MVRPPALTDSVPAAPGAVQAQPEMAPASAHSCRACGAALAQDQEWCLECGVARTAIQAPPDWRLGVAIVVAMIAIVVLITVIVWP
jgi:RNA polymerase subunit RPABC4/transcription elongation factor Spt4